MSDQKISKDERQDRIGMLIARLACLIIAVVFVLWVWIFKQPCDIDKQYLSCNVNGSVGDWIGSIMFISGLLVMSGIPRGVKQLTAPAGSSALNYAFAAFLVIGIAIILIF